MGTSGIILLNMKKIVSSIVCAALCTGAVGAAAAEAEGKKAPIDTVFAQGPVNPYGRFFTGTSYLTMLSENDGTFNAPIGNVTFEPGARTFWHKHSGGQILLVLAGEGATASAVRPRALLKKAT